MGVTVVVMAVVVVAIFDKYLEGMSAGELRMEVANLSGLSWAESESSSVEYMISWGSAFGYRLRM